MLAERIDLNNPAPPPRFTQSSLTNYMSSSQPEPIHQDQFNMSRNEGLELHTRARLHSIPSLSQTPHPPPDAQHFVEPFTPSRRWGYAGHALY